MVSAAGAALTSGAATLAASTQQNVGIVVALAVVVGWGFYLLANVKRSKPEVGSEIELAANRTPYLDDAALEGSKLERALKWGLISLVVVGVGLPLYWLAEPGRQSGAVEDFDETFVNRGAELFAATAEGGFNCAGCHGGMAAIGGEAPYTLTDPVTEKLRPVSWKAPALDTITLRMTDEQIRDVLTYGRKFSPMPAWGIEGGGPMNSQQIDNLVAYLHSIEITPEEAQEQATEDAQAELERLRSEGGDQPATMGAALFNLNCARCHTAGWSYGEAGPAGGGAFGPPLYNETTQFPLVDDHVEFVGVGTERGDEYGMFGQSSARMPFFGQVLTPEQVEAIVDYERTLSEPAVPEPGR